MAAVAAIVLGIALAEGLFRERSTISPPPVSQSPYRNTSPTVGFVGSSACADCHPEQHKTYLQTAHSRSLSDVQAEVEPPDGSFQHASSGRSYDVYRQGRALRHREQLVIDEGEVVAANDFPVRYLIGSGRHTRSYLVDVEGFLFESPITWYASREAWGMSPGFDRPNHWGFERAAGTGCLICHCGRIEPIGGSLHRIKFHETAVGCESCHGPGAEHVRVRSSVNGATSSGPANSDDWTIVHPGRMSREDLESICAACHLRGDATVMIRERKLGDFRPGLPLSDFRIDYHLQESMSQMKVVGHVEQMRLSACYQGAPSLTCTTCHDLHAMQHPPQAEQTRYRQKCLSCHTEQSCGATADERRRTEPADDCLLCHMPRGPTDIPHIAFTHHRIGIHRASAPPASPRIGTLVPFQDVSRLSTVDQQRCLGLAYLELSDKQQDDVAFHTYRQRAQELLEDVVRRGFRDPEVDAALARLYWEQGRGDAMELAERVLASTAASPESRVNSLFVLSDRWMQQSQPQSARDALEQLVTLRRHSQDWLILGLCRLQAGDRNGGLEALSRAAAINPFRPEIDRLRAQLCREAGEVDQAAVYEAQAQQLQRALQAPQQRPKELRLPER